MGLVLVWGKTSPEIKELQTSILLAGMTAFLFGNAEDLTKQVGVVQSLLATMAFVFLGQGQCCQSLIPIAASASRFFA